MLDAKWKQSFWLNISSGFNESTPKITIWLIFCGAPPSMLLNSAPDGSPVGLGLRSLVYENVLLWFLIWDLPCPLLVLFLLHISQLGYIQDFVWELQNNSSHRNVCFYPDMFKYWGVMVIKERVFYKYFQFTWNQETWTIQEN